MLSKEEISKLKINVFNQCDDETIRLVAEMLNHTEQLESDKQKLIEKLEEDIDELETLNDNYTDADIFEGIYTTRGQIIKTREILSILKGEQYINI